MPLSMHQASVSVFVRQLGALSKVLEKGAAFAEGNGVAPADILGTRLAPDMYALPRQVQVATDGAKGCVARLAGRDVPSYPDDETTFPELQARIAKTIAFAESVPAGEIDGSEARSIALKIGGREMTFLGQPYLLHFVLPNFFFHVTAAYAILRHRGVPLGKVDFLGGL